VHCKTTELRVVSNCYSAQCSCTKIKDQWVSLVKFTTANFIGEILEVERLGRKVPTYRFYRVGRHPFHVVVIFKRSTVESRALSLRLEHVRAPGGKFFVGEEIIEYVNCSVSEVA